LSDALAGIGVLITRPAHQAAQLAELVRNRGGEPVLFPALVIEPVPKSAIAGLLDRLAQFDLAVFVSPNAARLAMAHIAEVGGPPAALRVAAVGPGTVAELKKSGVRDIISPQSGFDSEALFHELLGRKLARGRVLIFRGQGGREWLGETLRARGAEVEYAECYRRVRPGYDMTALLPMWEQGKLQACVATSSEIVVNLFAMAGEAARRWLCQTPLFVPHPHVADTAFRQGTQTVFVAGAGDEALASGLETWFGQGRAALARAWQRSSGKHGRTT
jgi:uroporphyrinogen-III synthase